MSVRYAVGYSFLWVSRLVRALAHALYSIALLPEQVAAIIWTPQETDRYMRFRHWSSRAEVQAHSAFSEQSDWLGETERRLVQTYFLPGGAVLDLACGGGREAQALARHGLRVTACDWSPQMIAAAQRRAGEANLPIRFEVAALSDLPYPPHAFDYLLLTNIAYSLLAPRRRRTHFLRQAHSFLKPGGVFIVAFGKEVDGLPERRRWLPSLFVRLKGYAPFNRDYEPGDRIVRGCFAHFFLGEELIGEFEEATFIIKEWLWDEGYAVLAKP